MSKNPIFRDFYPPRWSGKWSSKRTGHRPQKPELVPFKEKAPMELKNYAVGLGQGQSNVACLPEMMRLFECLKENDYSQKNCTPMVTEFQNCFAQYSVANKQKKLAKIEAKPVPYEKLNTDQLNSLLRRFPQKVDKTLFTKEGFEKKWRKQ